MAPKLIVQFFSLTGNFARVKTETFATEKEALQAVKTYAEPQGYTNIKVACEDPLDGIRFIGRTPGGRNGRNIAIADYDSE